MRISYDADVDALSATFRDRTVTTRELAEGIVGECDAQDRLVGLEIHDAASRLGDAATLREVTPAGVELGAPRAVTPPREAGTDPGAT